MFDFDFFWFWNFLKDLPYYIFDITNAIVHFFHLENMEILHFQAANAEPTDYLTDFFNAFLNESWPIYIFNILFFIVLGFVVFTLFLLTGEKSSNLLNIETENQVLPLIGLYVGLFVAYIAGIFVVSPIINLFKSFFGSLQPYEIAALCFILFLLLPFLNFLASISIPVFGVFPYSVSLFGSIFGGGFSLFNFKRK